MGGGWAEVECTQPSVSPIPPRPNRLDGMKADLLLRRVLPIVSYVDSVSPLTPGMYNEAFLSDYALKWNK